MVGAFFSGEFNGLSGSYKEGWFTGSLYFFVGLAFFVILPFAFLWHIAPKSILFPELLFPELNKNYKLKEFHEDIKFITDPSHSRLFTDSSYIRLRHDNMRTKADAKEISNIYKMYCFHLRHATNYMYKKGFIEYMIKEGGVLNKMHCSKVIEEEIWMFTHLQMKNGMLDWRIWQEPKDEYKKNVSDNEGWVETYKDVYVKCVKEAGGFLENKR